MINNNFDSIPADLQQYPYWCNWRYEQKPRKLKPDKVPYNPLTTQRAKSNNHGTFTAFETVKQSCAEYDGVGVGLFGDLAAVDIDNCIDPETRQMNEIAGDTLNIMKTYTELSPSRTGLRLFFYAPGFQYDKKRYYTKNSKNGLEIYVAGCTNRFVTVTGDVYGFPLPIADGCAALPLLLEKHMQKSKATDTEVTEQLPACSLLTDEQVIEKASISNEKFAKLYNGNREFTECESQSEADLSLCNILAFWCGRDMEQMNRIFIKSKLYREKWERDDYSTMTLEKAARDCSKIYDPAEYLHRQVVKDFAKMGITTPKINPLSDKERYKPSDRGNGFLFADMFTDMLRYCPQSKGWFVYREGRWQPDNGNAFARECAKIMPKHLCGFLPEIEDADKRKAYSANMMQLYGLAARSRMLEDAQSVTPIRLEDLDTNTDLLNVLNGTLNLKTMVFNPHNSADLISKKAGAAFIPGVDCPLWNKTLSEIFENKTEIIHYFQKV